MILRLVTALASGVGKHAKLSAFYFHRVVSEPDPLLPGEPDARQFDAILGWIGAQFRVLDPVEACNRLFSGSLPSRAAIMSFDDGYVDNFDVALPILQRHRMKAAFFVASGYLNGGLMFNDRIIEAIRQTTATAIAGDAYGGGTIDLPLRSNHERRVGIERILDSIKHLPPTKRDEHVERVEHALGARGLSRKMMVPDEVVALHRSGMAIGGHTRTHPILCALDDVVAETEISGGIDDLAALIGERPVIFAYPNGRRGRDFDARHVTMVGRTGCIFGFTTEPGAATYATKRLELPRFTPWGRTRARFGLLAVRNLIGHQE